MVDWKNLNEEMQLDKRRFYVVISGDKGFRRDDYIIAVIDDMVKTIPTQELLTISMDKLLTNAKENYDEIIVIVGDNNGADSLAEDYAISHNYNVFKYEADWESSGNKAGFERNEKMFLHVGRRSHKAAVLFWDGQDYMTRNLIYQAYNYCTPLRVWNYSEKRFLTQDEIKEIQYEERQRQAKYMKV
jgi:hypothetical protein